MSRDRANPVFPRRVLSDASLGPFQCDDLSLKKPRHCRDHVCSIGQCRTRLRTPGMYDAKLAGWCCVSWQMRLSHVDPKGAPLGIPNQVMWGPKDKERTESMASGCGRTLPEEGQVCRLLTPCSRVLIMRSNTTGKALASHRTRTSREEGATDTRSRWQARAMEGPGAPGTQDWQKL